MTDAITAEDMEALRDRIWNQPYREQTHIIDPMAYQHLKEHDGGKPGCDTCHRIWGWFEPHERTT